MTENEAVNEVIQDEKDALIAQLRDKLGKQVAWSHTQTAICNEYGKLLHRVKNQLAVQTIVQGTHYERNEQCRDIVRAIVNELERPLDQYIRIIPMDMDDIPF